MWLNHFIIASLLLPFIKESADIINYLTIDGGAENFLIYSYFLYIFTFIF